MGNLVLAAVLVAAQQGVTVRTNPRLPRHLRRRFCRRRNLSPLATETPGMGTWRRIASADYHQYIANLRAVGCPEWLIRDIIVAAIDDSYRQKNKSDLDSSPPGWARISAVRRPAAGRRSGRVRLEKRALVKSLLGYGWDSQANDIWNLDLLSSLMWWTFPDDKVSLCCCSRTNTPKPRKP